MRRIRGQQARKTRLRAFSGILKAAARLKVAIIRRHGLLTWPAALTLIAYADNEPRHENMRLLLVSNFPVQTIRTYDTTSRFLSPLVTVRRVNREIPWEPRGTLYPPRKDKGSWAAWAAVFRTAPLLTHLYNAAPRRRKRKSIISNVVARAREFTIVVFIIYRYYSCRAIIFSSNTYTVR